MRGYCRQQLVTPQNTVARLPTCITSKTVLESVKVWFTRTLVAWVTALARPDVLAMNLGDLIAQESGLDVEHVKNGHYLFAGFLFKNFDILQKSTGLCCISIYYKRQLDLFVF